MKTKITNDGNGSLPRHIDDADLISHLDGELDRVEQDHARVHLEGCWNCRSRLLALQNSIENFLRARNQIVPGELPPSGAAVAQFRRRLAEHRNAPVALRLQLGQWLRSIIPAPFGRGIGRGSLVTPGHDPKPSPPALSQREREEVGRITSPWPSLLPSLSFVLRYKKTAFATILAALALTVLLLDPFRWNRVAADELLTRASAYEFLNETPKGKVLKVRAHIDKISLPTKTTKNLGEIETDSDSLTARMFVSAEPVSGAARQQTVQDRERPTSVDAFAGDFNSETTKYFATQGWLPQVSVSLYKGLVAGRGLNGNEGVFAYRRGATYEIHHAFASAHPSHITETVLALNAQTYAPQAVSIFTAEGNDKFEYRLTRTSIESIERTPEVAKLFEPLANENSKKTTTSPSTPNTLNPTSESAAPGPQPPTPVSASADLEVEVLRLLNQAGADLGEQVSVSRNAGGPVRVTGIVETDQRKSEILRALQPVSGNPAVRIEVRTVAEAMAERRDKRDASRPTTSESVEVPADSFPAYQDLRTRMSDEEARVFAARMVSRSHSAMRHAWALKRLMTQFSANDLATLQPEAHAKWIVLIQSHAREFERETVSLRQQLEPIFASGAATGEAGIGEIRNDADLMRAVERLVSLASTNYDVVRSAFTITRESTTFSAIKSPQFWQSLRSAEAVAASISRAH